MEKRIREVIEEQQKKEKIIWRESFERIEKTLSMEEITTVKGPRRAGKSTALKAIVEKEGGIYINFEDERLPRNPSFLREVSEEYKKGIIAFDEVHLIKGWEGVLSSLMKKRKIIVSGSTSSLLSREYGTFLTGRHISIELFTLSFEEYKKFDRGDYESYLYYGGYPRVVLSKNKALLNDYFMDIIVRDVVERFKIARPDRIKEMAKFLLSHSSKTFTERRIANILSISPNTAGDYLTYINEAYLIEFSETFSPKLGVRKKLPFKAYAIDHSYPSFFLKDKAWKSKALETAIFMELRRKGFELSYNAYPEVDVIIHKNYEPMAAINISYDMESKKTKEREEKITKLNIKKKAIISVKGESKSIETFKPWELEEFLKSI